ncbi:TonB-dependent receptor [Novosphingobium sp. KCTC 2891]|uniref:TonB-dependent receptor n=1 Tax=Novosphingobium sp. KCTC 2891 TaxID=2989730 RepID=UPI0022238146|nr:TonB-dependent receptor [Novosphingobium sp. KCTC 2891]MCW1383644.1 TonB-dependent receptor [Novosphingobium sp. KCTC 2891]
MKTSTSRLVARLLGGAMASAIALSAGVARAEDQPQAQPQPQNAATQGDRGIGDIIVTARKVEERLQDVPVAVTAFSGDALRMQNVVNVGDVARFTPGLLTVPATSNPTGLFLAIRGQVQGDVLATLEPSVGTYVDGVYVARAYGINADLVDVASVQVLKGPQGTLFGRNTSAGALLIETKKPNLNRTEAELSATYGRYNQRSGTGIINVPLVEDKLAVRGAFQAGGRDGYVTDDITGAKYNDLDTYTGRVKVLFEPAPGVSLLAQGDWFGYNSHGNARSLRYGGPNYLVNAPAGLVSAGIFPDCSAPQNAFSCAPVPTYGALVDNNLLGSLGVPQPVLDALGVHSLPHDFAYYSQLNAKNPNRTAADWNPYTRVRTQAYSLTGSVDTGIGTFKVIGGYRQATSRASIDLDGTPYQILASTQSSDLHQWSVEGQLTGSTASKVFDYVAGVTYFTEAGNDYSLSGTLVPLQPPGYFRGVIDNKSFGVYAQGTWHLTDALGLTGGLRWSSDKKNLVTHNQSLVPIAMTSAACALPGAVLTPGAAPGENCPLGHSDTFKQLSYLISLDYHITPDVLVYAKMSKGYRSGGENLRASGDIGTFAPFIPEINYEEEIGLKADLFDHRVRFNLAGYYNKIHNAQRSQLLAVASGPLAGSLLTVLGNAQRVRNLGVEADLQVAVTRDLTLQASGSLNDFKYLKYDVPASFGSTVMSDHRGENQVMVPDSSFTVAANYKHDFGGVKLFARVDYSWIAKYLLSSDTCGVYPVPAYGTGCIPLPQAQIDANVAPAAGLLGARIGFSFDDDRYKIEFWGTNLTNNRDFTSGFNVTPFGLVSGIRRDPAMYGVTVGAKF